MGVYKVTGKPFGELIHNFIVGGYETYLIPCVQVMVKVVASVSKNKHDNKYSNSRASIRLYRNLNVNVDTGPTVVLVKTF